MDLNTIREVKRPPPPDDLTDWRQGYAWLGGGTWLFSEPQLAVDTLIDLETLNWRPLGAPPRGPEIAAASPLGASISRRPAALVSLSISWRRRPGPPRRCCASAATRC